MDKEPLSWWDKGILLLAAACLALGIALLAGCEPLAGDKSEPGTPHSTPIQYGTPK